MAKRPPSPSSVVPQWESRRMRVAELAPADYNPRKISVRAADGLRASLARFGELGGIVWNERTRRLVGGHQRVKALLALGVEEVDVRVVDLPVAEEKALNVTLNNPAISGEFDFEVLDVVLDDIRAELPNAFEELHLEDIRPLFAPSTGGDSSAGPGHGGGSDADATSSRNESQNLTKGLTDPDETPEPAPEPVTRVGDVWVLGDHRIICGDSTDAATVARLLGGGLAGLVFTDPPYGVEFQSRMSKGGTATRFAKLQNDDVILPVAPVVWQAMAEDTAAFVWTSQAVYPVWREQFSAFYKSTVIWHKPGGGIGDLEGDYARDYEMALFCVKGRPKFRGKRGMAVWKIAKDSAESYLHPTQKPVELAERAISDFSDAGDVVLDLFSGSGSTLIACERTSRRARVSELDPAYADVAVRRWQAFTGKQAVLDGDGRTFDDIAVDRGVEAAGGTRG